MTVLPELRDTLHDAVERGVFAAAPRRRGRRWVALVATTGVVIAGGGAAVAAGLWHPQLGSGGHVVSRAKAHVPARPDGLGVLERPQAALDRGPDVEAALRRLSSQGLGEVDTTGIRLLGRHDGGVALLVPAGRVGPDDPAVPALRRYNQLCVVFTTATAATQHCGTGAGLRRGRLSGFAPRDHGGIISGLASSHVYGLVPDGVDAVRATFAGGVVVTARVRRNFYDLERRETTPPREIAWVAADGRSLRMR